MAKTAAVLIALLIFLTVIPVSSAEGIGLTLDGKKVTFSESTGTPFIDAQSRTLVPFRVVLEKFGCTVQWKQAEQMAEARKNGVVVQVPLGKNYILVNGVRKANDTAAQVKNGRTYLPIRAVLEAFGASVTWNQTAKSVIVTSSGVQNPDKDLQVVRGEVESDRYPDITVKKGLPVRFILHAEGRNLNNCNNAIVIPDFDIGKELVPGDNIIEFTPAKAGTYEYTCWMGMVYGQIKVAD